MTQRADAPGGVWASEGPLPCDVLCPVEDALWKNNNATDKISISTNMHLALGLNMYFPQTAFTFGMC